MLNINLLPGEEFKKEQSGKYLQWALGYGKYIIIATEIIVLFAFFSRFKLDRELTDLHQSIKQKQAVILAASDFESEFLSLQARIKTAKSLAGQREIPVKVLQTLTELTPQNVILKELSLDGDKIIIVASSLSNADFTIFLNNLSSSKMFTDISLDEIGKSSSGAGIQFKATAHLTKF